MSACCAGEFRARYRLSSAPRMLAMFVSCVRFRCPQTRRASTNLRSVRAMLARCLRRPCGPACFSYVDLAKKDPRNLLCQAKPSPSRVNGRAWQRVPSGSQADEASLPARLSMFSVNNASFTVTLKLPFRSAFYVLGQPQASYQLPLSEAEASSSLATRTLPSPHIRWVHCIRHSRPLCIVRLKPSLLKPYPELWRAGRVHKQGVSEGV